MHEAVKYGGDEAWGKESKRWSSGKMKSLSRSGLRFDSQNEESSDRPCASDRKMQPKWRLQISF